MSHEIEAWKTIPDYPAYSVSTLGRVCSRQTSCHKDPLILRPIPDKDGHMKVSLSKNGVVKNFFVHRLVATAFLPNPKGLPVVNHKDENPANNAVSNLEWCTVRENTNYNQMPKRRAASLRRQIVQKSLDGTSLRIWESRSAIEAQTGFSGSNITKVCQGKRRTANGYLWVYADSIGLSGQKK